MITKSGKCAAHGHAVVVMRDVDGNVQATVGDTMIDPLPDEESTEPIMIACPSCVDLVNELRLQD